MLGLNGNVPSWCIYNASSIYVLVGQTATATNIETVTAVITIEATISLYTNMVALFPPFQVFELR